MSGKRTGYCKHQGRSAEPPLRKLLWTFAFLLTFSLAKGSPENERSGATAEVSFATLDETIPEVLWYVSANTSENEWKPLSIGRNRRGAPIQVSADGPVTLHLEERSPEGGVTYNPVKEILLPGEGKRFFVLLRRTQRQGQLRLSSLVLDDGLEAHPPETLRLFNFHPFPLAYSVLGGDRGIIPSLGEVIINYPAPKGDFPRLILRTAIRRNDEWVRTPTITEQIFPDTRLLIFSVVLRKVDGEDHYQRFRFVDRAAASAE